jgi:hypothetical protein
MLRTMRSGPVSNPRTAAMTLDRCSLVNLSIVVPLGLEAAHLTRRGSRATRSRFAADEPEHLRVGAAKSSSHVPVQRYHFRPTLQHVEIVRPLLHHAPALGEVLRVVVGGADLIAFGVTATSVRPGSGSRM